MDKKQVLTRMSQESYNRLQELSGKYGVSSSALLVMLINERWLQENNQVVDIVESSVSPEQSANSAKSRKRHKTRNK
jgi:predicted DNA-binding protein